MRRRRRPDRRRRRSLSARSSLAVVRRRPARSGRRPTPAAVRFTDVTDAAGIRFRTRTARRRASSCPRRWARGVAVLDFDRDGRPDLFFVNGRAVARPARRRGPTQALYRNKGDGTFEDVTAAVGLDVELYGMGVAVGDFDNDGWPDLFVTAVGGNRLFRNVGGQAVRGRDRARPGVGGPGLAGRVRRRVPRQDAEPIPFPSSARSSTTTATAGSTCSSATTSPGRRPSTSG